MIKHIFLGLLRSFPMIDLASPNFILSLIMLTINHIFAFGYFGEVRESDDIFEKL